MRRRDAPRRLLEHRNQTILRFLSFVYRGSCARSDGQFLVQLVIGVIFNECLVIMTGPYGEFLVLPTSRPSFRANRCVFFRFTRVVVSTGD